MKRMLCTILAVLFTAVLAGGISGTRAESAGAFQPRLDTDTSCEITVIGTYSNFEALEAEFDRFNEFYPDVELSYVKPDDYNNLLGTVLESSDAPNIFFSYQWMCGNEKYELACSHMEDLSDPQLGLELDCLRSGLLNTDAEGHLLMVPIFARNYGMLVNNDLFAKEGLQVPTTWEELLAVCEAFLDKGYASPMMGYSADASGCLMNNLVYPEVVAALAGDAETLQSANALEPAAGECMRAGLEAMMQLIGKGFINLEKCGEISDNYTQVILRFFEGDVPMMICTGDTVSGTGKRESQSEAFSKAPFTYSFAPVPMSEAGGYFIDSPSIQFSVNKTCDNLDMTNEFMRFLISRRELNGMASVKRLVTPTTDLSFDAVYAPFAGVPDERILSPEMIGITDPLAAQVRNAAYKVGIGEITIDEAVSRYGSF
uniref:Sugar ABC transporter substrate-binding protein n=1 Tax=uncultured bacterium Contigcl_23 TaxID=1393667 RepID=W0FRU9_9BACT|nr:sugar ABC transporter substrate-binding protein [uncultured bacterium Contigcl_23]